ncbi:MAG: protein translocase subunit SecD [Planctomycetaceae bacterium]|nr:protein translocase subunit SecD [Planctomycetaceae bacterium]
MLTMLREKLLSSTAGLLLALFVSGSLLPNIQADDPKTAAESKATDAKDAAKKETPAKSDAPAAKATDDKKAADTKPATPAKSESKAPAKTEPAKSEAAKTAPAKIEPPKNEPAAEKAPADAKQTAESKDTKDSKSADTKAADAKLPGELAAVGAQAAPGEPVDRTSSSLMAILVFCGLVVASGVLGTVWANGAGLPDRAMAFGFVVFATVLSVLVTWVYWPPKLGIDLSGGFVLNYRIDRTKSQGQDQFSMEELIGAITRRVNPGGTKEVTVRPYGGDEIEIIIPDATQEELASLKEIITKLGSLEFRITANSRDHAAIIAQANATTEDDVYVKAEGEQPRLVAQWVPLHPDTDREQVPPPGSSSPEGLVTRVTAQGVTQVLVMYFDDLVVTGERLVGVGRDVDRFGDPAVNFRFDALGASRFSQLTQRNLPENGFHRRLGVLLDHSFFSAPNIMSVITDSGQITGIRDEKKVQAQIEVFKAGKLPAALYHEPTSELYIGPTLGRDTVEKGVRSMLVGTAAVVIFMLIYYRFAGIVANIAVVMNVLITISLMMMFQAAFTLSGLAGLALTVGMAVDANVLIYERMREELAKGTTLRMAIRNGFDRASSTIIDANVTTLIAGFVLYWIGTDQVKGFAVTLIIGLIANLFTAITVSRAIFDTVEKLRWVKTLKFMQLMTTTNIDFVGPRKLAVSLSLIVIGIGLAACWVRGKGLLDIDFTGGTSVQVLFKEPKDVAKVREMVGTLPDVTVQDVKLSTENAGVRYLIVTSKPNSVTDANGQVIEDDIVERELHKIFKGELAANELTVSDVKPIGKPAPKQGAALELRDTDNLLAFAPEALLAQAETKSDAAKTDAAKTEPAKTAAPATGATPAPGAPATPAAAPAKVDLFEGGTLAKLNFSEAIGQQTLTDLLRAQLKETKKENVALELFEPQKQQGKTSSYGEWSLKIALPQAETQSMLDTLKKKLVEEPFFPASSQIGATVAGTTQQQAVMAIVVSLALILAYVWFRFSQVTFGIAAVVAVIHDVLVTLGALALSYWLAGPLGVLGVDQFKINLPIIAAFLTIIGYSLNDTIVIFDRIREIRGKSTAITPELINLSVNQTLSRTILTASTVFLTVLVLYAIGGQGIHGFAFALVVGSIAGTYSTIYIATPIVLWLHGWNAGASTSAGTSVAQQSAS